MSQVTDSSGRREVVDEYGNNVWVEPTLSEQQRERQKKIDEYNAGGTTVAPEGHPDYQTSLFDVIMNNRNPQTWQKPFVMQNKAKAGTSNFALLNAAMARIRRQSRGQSLLQGQQQQVLSPPEAPTAPSLLTGS